MVKYNLWCQDCTCGASGKGKDFCIELSDEEVKEEIYCPNKKEDNLGEPLKLLGYIPFGGFMKFSGKLINAQEKQKLLWKRSHIDFKKNIEEKKNEMHRQFINDVKKK